MKVKLLKKIRKRYVITHYPTQYRCLDEIFRGEFYVLSDTENSFRTDVGVQIVKDITKANEKFFQYVSTDKNEAIKILLTKIQYWARRDYPNAVNRKVRKTKIWYNK